MALLTAGAAGINVDTLSIIDLLLGDVQVATATQFVLKDGAWLEQFQGQFTYNGAGTLTGGTVTGWQETFQGNVVFEVSGFSVPVPTFLNWVNTSDNEAVRSTILGGADSIAGSAVADVLRGYAGNDTITGGEGQGYLRGDEGDDVLTGGSAFDDINGNMGNDTVSTGAGDDYAVGGKDNDSLSGQAGGDVVWGNLGNDTQDGGDGNDQVRGGQGDDTITGGAGNDFVSGDRGADTIAGGTGADIFHGSQDAGIDRVVDFNLAEGDRVQLDPGTTYTLSQVGADTVLDMGGGHQMILVGVQMSTLASGWVFGA
jgi:Ca2+-binding RTX toxin-like protein